MPLRAADPKTIGNFWVDLTRTTLYVLLPLSIIVALAYGLLGTPQTLLGSLDATTLDGAKQTIAMGPMASQEAIKQLGTNGGGFMNANAAHPFENPNEWANILSIFAMLLVSTALPFTFGRMVGDPRQGNALLKAMYILLIVGVGAAYWAEASGNPLFAQFGIDPAGGNMEGKEVRFGIAMSALYAVVTTGLSCGAVNAMHDSFTPLGGLLPMLFIQLGEILPGGTGSGLYGMIVIALLAVFVAGSDGRPHAGISRQEDRSQGDEACHPGAADPAIGDPRLLRRFGDDPGWARWSPQSRSAWLERNSLCLLLGDRQ